MPLTFDRSRPVLGIESSCDETAAAVVRADGTVLSDVVSSQVAIHAPWGGVVPELAARDHVKSIVPVVRGALAKAGVELGDLGGIAVTVRPGLAGALLVGAPSRGARRAVSRIVRRSSRFRR